MTDNTSKPEAKADGPDTPEFLSGRIRLKAKRQHYTADGRIIDAGKEFEAYRSHYVNGKTGKFDLPNYLIEIKDEPKKLKAKED